MSDRRASSENGVDARASRLLRWLSIGGNRLGITGGLAVAIFLLTWGLISTEVIAVGPGSTAETMFGSGVVSGLFTLITVTLSINQLISTRVFGAPNTLSSKFEGGKELRQSVEAIADREASPVAAAGFIAFIGQVLGDRARAFGASAARDRQPAGDELEAFRSAIERYATQIQRVSETMHPVSVITTSEGSDYARYIREAERLTGSYADQLSDEATDHLDAIRNLLQALSISRQYYKTIAIQQDFAQLSRLLIFVSLPAVLTAIYVPLIYQSGPAATIAPAYLPVVLSGAIAIVTVPLVLLLVFLLRITTVMRYTVSVGPFVAPSEWPWNE